MALGLALAGCAPPPPSEGTPGTELIGVRGQLGPWQAEAARVQLIAGMAHAEDVRATGSAAEGAPPLHIDADAAEWDLKGHTARFTAHVRVTRGPVTLTADQLDVRYTANNRVDVVSATGHVVVTRGERVARADRATLTAGDGRVVLTGAPTLTEGINALTGDRIEVYLDQEKATCAGAAGAPCRLTVQDGLGPR